MKVIGVDPGVTGAIAHWNGNKLFVCDIPVVNKRINIPELVNIFHQEFHDADSVFIEDVHAMPKQGVSSVFKFGRALGIVEGLVHSFDIPSVNYVSPHVWKKAMGLSSDKELSREKALRQFPRYAEYFQLKKHKDRAEAALFALYGYNRLH